MDLMQYIGDSLLLITRMLFPYSHRTKNKKVHLKGHDFWITIVHGSKDNFLLLGYICEVGTMHNLEETNPTTAISTVYQQIFNPKSIRYSGPLVIGWNYESITDPIKNTHTEKTYKMYRTRKCTETCILR